ncbi:MAG: hypothetical protein DCF19_03720 [Pseudanabaena frigida]|uniref:Cyanoexosortase A system-associated protein n=1 Tax=Pseudanabaena frigida TaxID=945775 RepID=A0A2W4YLB7_9CYAN|nr:MAG: hypothetical protein DCF19_03720 [Pseudanabaena frigida]
MSQKYKDKIYKDKKSRIKAFKLFKISCLITVFTSTCIAISISLFTPNFKSRSLQFPNQVSLSEWKFLSSNNLEHASTNGAIASRQYFYVSPTQEDLRIDAMYVNGVASIPEALGLLGLNYSSNNLSIRYIETIGYYALFADRERAYLSSCINPYGLTTFTKEQFINNRNTYDITLERIITYAIGFTDFRDERCLFTTISVPLINQKSVNQRTDSLSEIHQKLEKIWINWYQNWKYDFPKS